MQREARFDGVEDAANRVRHWGTKRRFGGGADTLTGRMKEGVGRIAGDDNLADEGIEDQAVGVVENTAGRWGQAAGETLHELNR